MSSAAYRTGMVLVNNPVWAHNYWPLEHAEWNGWTPNDLVFPFFLFIVGVAIPLAFGKRIPTLTAPRAFPQSSLSFRDHFSAGRIPGRLPYFHLSTIRFPECCNGFAVCYFWRR